MAKGDEEMQEGNREDALRVHDEINEALQSFNRAAIESANVAVRSLLLINGGASVALLAFIGAIETGNPEVDSRVLVEPIWWFAVGVGLAVFVAVLAYVVNYLDAAIMSEMRRIWHPPYVQEAPFMWKNIFRNAAFYAALLLSMFSLILYFWGVWSIIAAISNLGI